LCRYSPSFVITWARSESNQIGADARAVYSRARSHAGLRARNEETARGIFPGRLQIASAVLPRSIWSLSLRRSWAAAGA
jgi:hypothetical protein